MIAVFISNSSVFGLLTIDDEESRKTLKGLKEVYVSVNFGTEDVGELEKIGLSKEVIRTDVELRLRLAGINVASKEKFHGIPGIPQFTVDIGAYTIGIRLFTQEKGIAYSIHVELFQDTYLANDSTIRTAAGTWSIGSVGFGYTNKNIVIQIRDSIKDHVDRFIGAYLSVNAHGPSSLPMSFPASSPGPATLVSPSGTITTTTPTYTWNAVPGATWYYLWVNDSTGNRINRWYTAAETGCPAGTGICSIDPATALATGEGFWWILTWNALGYGSWSLAMPFTVNP